MIRTLVEIRDGRVSIQETADETTVTVTVDGASSSLDLDETDRLNRQVRELGERLRTMDTELERRTEERDERERARANLEKSLSEEIRKLRAQVAEYDWDRKTERYRANRLQTEVDRLKKGHVCTNACKPNAHVAFTGRQRLEELEREVCDETERADQAEKALEESRSLVARQGARHDRTLRARDVETEERVKRRVTEMAAKIQKINDAVHSPEILSALKAPWHVRTQDQHEALADAVRDVRQILGSPGPETSPA